MAFTVYGDSWTTIRSLDGTMLGLQAVQAGYGCCCNAPGSCCDVLANFATLKVTASCGAETVTFNVTGGGGTEQCTQSWSGEEATFTDFTMADFVFCCRDNPEGDPEYDVSFNLSGSAPCDQAVAATITQPAPCCPLDITFTIPSGDCCTAGMTIRVQTQDDVVCP